MQITEVWDVLSVYKISKVKTIVADRSEQNQRELGHERKR